VNVRAGRHPCSNGSRLVPIDAGILGRAAELQPPDLRTLDAIHLATALLLQREIAGLITYDGRLARGAAAADIAVLRPL
jgi:predicted nucleic acid-binding protein